MSCPKLVAHRGYAAQFPENTLCALEEAIRAGACFVEFDVQLCADGTPVLFHDTLLKRTTGREGNLLDLNYETIKDLEAAECERFGERFVNRGIHIPRLDEAVALLKSAPQITAFVEIKTESLDRHGIGPVLETVLEVLRPVTGQWVIISYSAAALEAARDLSSKPIGWVLSTWSDESRTAAAKFSPDFLICNHEKIPTDLTPLWPGPWQWCFYEVTDPALALALHARGADLIETMDIGAMLADAHLKTGGFFDRPAL